MCRDSGVQGSEFWDSRHWANMLWVVLPSGRFRDQVAEGFGVEGLVAHTTHLPSPRAAMMPS